MALYVGDHRSCPNLMGQPGSMESNRAISQSCDRTCFGADSSMDRAEGRDGSVADHRDSDHYLPANRGRAITEGICHEDELR